MSFKKIMLTVLLVGVASSIILPSIQNHTQQINWTDDGKVKVCKAYIADLFGKSTSIMTHYKTDENNLIYIKHIRSDDQTTWRNVCEIKNPSMIWAGWIKYNDTQGYWGRWREEDRVELHYDETSKTISFTGPNTKVERTVHL